MYTVKHEFTGIEFKMARAKRYNMLMSNEGYAAFTEIAEKENRLLADVIRDALDHYLKMKGRSVSTEVDRGGYRGGAKDKGSSPQ
jgi:hypothetical protein